MDAEVDDPTLTNYYTNSLGVVTNGSAFVTSFVLPAPPAPELDTLNILSNGNFVFSMVGPVASNCTVQVSSDLKVWNNAVTITNFNGLAHIINASGNTNHEFYRAMLTETPPVNLEYQDLANTSLGNASESIACCVSNLGSSGQDGLTSGRLQPGQQRAGRGVHRLAHQPDGVGRAMAGLG